MPLQLLPAALEEMLNVRLTPDQERQFEIYSRELIEWNTNRANLTAITEPLAVEIRHFLNSLTILKALTIPQGANVVDVGTGAGFPGLPLRIMQPDLKLTLMEATGKKTAFLSHMAAQLGMQDVQVVHARAEEAGQMPQHREAYNLVVARSVAHMPILMEYLLPLCKVGGLVVAMKGESAEQESKLAEHALKVLGGKLAQIVPVTLPNVSEPHFLVIFEKIAPTPARFPRKPGIPSKMPL